VPSAPSAEALAKVAALVAAWSKHDQLQTAIVTNVGEVPPSYDRAPFLPYQIL
jgi:hypothetical protein